MVKSNQTDLQQIFLGLQQQMLGKLSLNRKALNHPVAKGDATELEWINLLSSYLPTRYRVKKAFIIDHEGSLSDQIDIVVFDRHYSPFLFKQNGQIYIPAESVYCVIEVKSKLTLENIKYASKKVSTVRSLKRTSAFIIDKGKKCKPRENTYIMGGILSIDGTLSDNMKKSLTKMSKDRFINIGCSLEGSAFFINHANPSDITTSTHENSLIFFFLKLLQALQNIGTVAPMEIDKYARNL